MSALSTRDALAKALRDHAWRGNPTICRCGWDSPGLGRTTGESHAEHVAEALPVIDAATLADDEAVIEVMARDAFNRAYRNATWVTASWDSQARWLAEYRHAVRALAAALTERGQS